MATATERQRMCEQKKWFRSRAVAEDSRKRMSQANQYAYQCPYCAGWHLATAVSAVPHQERKP